MEGGGRCVNVDVAVAARIPQLCVENPSAEISLAVNNSIMRGNDIGGIECSIFDDSSFVSQECCIILPEYLEKF